eukprot:scpid113163/ scgid9098/ 
MPSTEQKWANPPPKQHTSKVQLEHQHVVCSPVLLWSTPQNKAQTRSEKRWSKQIGPSCTVDRQLENLQYLDQVLYDLSSAASDAFQSSPVSVLLLNDSTVNGGPV